MSNPYLEAARLIHERKVEFSCSSLVKFNGNVYERYQRMFSPEDHSTVLWLDEFIGEAQREWRLTALCLAAAMYEEGDL